MATYFEGTESRWFDGTPDNIICVDCRCGDRRPCIAARTQMARMQHRRDALPIPPKQGDRVVLAGPSGGTPGSLDANLNFTPDAPIKIRRRRRAVR
jgi:hypothetical protein